MNKPKILLQLDPDPQPSSFDALPEDVAVNPRELKVAKQLIDSLSTDFNPEEYEDEYRKRVLELIEAKAEGEEIAIQPAAEEPAKVVNLMAALEASLKAAQERRAS